METLPAEIIQKDAKVNFNQIINQLLNILSNQVVEKLMEEVKLFHHNNTKKEEEKKPEYYTQREAYERLGISRTSFHRRIKSGEIKADGSNGRPLYSVKQIENYLKTVDTVEIRA